MANTKTQGRRLISALKRRPHTYMEMLAYGVSGCPWRRVIECLAADEKVDKGKRGKLVTWRVVRVIPPEFALCA